MSSVEPLAQKAPESAATLLSALEQVASTLIVTQLDAMFASADDVLFEMANKARNGDEKTSFMNTMRTVRVERPRIIASFKSALREALRRTEDGPKQDLDVSDLSSWTLQDDSMVEETIAVQNMESKAASLHADELTELEQRLLRLAEDTKGAVSAKALSPARILEAFKFSMKGLTSLDVPSRLVLYKLFDRVVVANLGEVFSGANDMLDARGVKPKVTAIAKARGAPAKVKPAIAAQVMSGRLPSSNFAAAMQQHRGGGGGFGSGGGGGSGFGGAPGSEAEAIAQQNSQIADEMLAVLEAAGNGKSLDSWMPSENLALATRLFEDMYEGDLSSVTKPVLGRLQFPVMKYAVADPTFFKDPAHPVRALVHDVYQILASVKGAAAHDLSRIEELVTELLKRFDPDPTKLKEAAKTVKTVTAEEADQFLEQQRVRLEQQKQAAKSKVRQIVGQEIKLRMGDRVLPKPIVTLLLSGFAPVMAAHYGVGGINDPGWGATVALLDRLLNAIDRAAQGASDRGAEEDQVVASVVRMLTSAGMNQDRVEQLTDPVVEALDELAAGAATRAQAATDTGEAPVAEVASQPQPPAPVPAPAPKPAAPKTHILLRGGDWFRVHCESTKNSRWLKLTSYYSGPDVAVFVDFDGSNFMRMRASAFLEDLADGRSALVDPDTTLQEIIKALPAPPALADRKPSGETWFKAAKS